MRLLSLAVVALLAALAPAQPRYTPKTDPARLERLKKTPMPKVTQPILHNTPEADAVCSALAVFPPDNPWNTLVTDWPIHPRSKQIIATVGVEKPLRANPDMAFVIVPPNQKKVPLLLSPEYKDECDPGPYPIPDNMPIEGWPAGYTRDRTLTVTLRDVQENKLKEDGDRHAIVVDPVNRKLYEFYQAQRSAAGWKGSGAAIFDLASNKLRPETWTSTDAAGLPIFPAIIRNDELERGVIDHALRVTVRRSQRAYVYPARHFASRLTDPDLPRMGERLRLRQDFDTSGFSRNVRTVLEALKRYGMFVADNGIEWGMSSTADDRVPAMHEELRRVKGSDFEVVVAPPGYVAPK